MARFLQKHTQAPPMNTPRTCEKQTLGGIKLLYRYKSAIFVCSCYKMTTILKCILWRQRRFFFRANPNKDKLRPALTNLTYISMRTPAHYKNIMISDHSRCTRTSNGLMHERVMNAKPWRHKCIETKMYEKACRINVTLYRSAIMTRQYSSQIRTSY